jgi:hypothetical protein
MPGIYSCAFVCFTELHDLDIFFQEISAVSSSNIRPPNKKLPKREFFVWRAQ